jgi:predicted DNA-binding transcriptional regulator YafY
MPRKKETLTLSVPPGTKERLEKIAERLGFRWGNNPSASKLISAIAQNEVSVGSIPLTANQIKALRQAVTILIDTGFIEEAQSVIDILLTQGDMEAPLKQMLLQQFTQPTEAWREQIDQYITQQQPFHMAYKNSQGQILEFTARYAEIHFYEKRYYLQIWCEETADVESETPDLPELWHNRCFRFDRIQALHPISGDWRGQLDTIKVYLHFRGWLRNAYEPKPDDVENQVVGEIRQVVRTVANPFWLIREISRYWEDCEIVAPESLRQRMKEKLAKMNNLYNR